VRRVTHSAGFAFVVYAFWVTMLGTTLPTPLYPLYEQRYGFGELRVTVIFALYAIGVVVGLIAFGNLSDDVGRKIPLFAGLGMSALSALLFLTAGSVPPLYPARVISGLSAGLFTGTATAYLVDLSTPARRRAASFVSAAVLLVGLGCGALLSGLLATYASHPLRLPFAVDLVLIAVAIAGLLLVPETVERRRLRFRPQRLAVPPEVRGVFLRAATAGFAAFAVTALFSSVGPTFLGQVLDEHSPALAGLIIFLMFAMALAGQLVVRRMSDLNALTLGCALLLLSTTLLGLSVALEALSLLIASAVVTGLGQGAVFAGALAAINARAPVDRRGETASSFFVVTYLGLSLPAIALGVAINATSIKPAALVFCVVIGAVVLAVILSQLRSETRHTVSSS
jgi:MFS family permease